MDDLIRAATTSTPEIRFEAGTGRLVLRGESYPENAFEFYRPLLEWVAAYLDSSPTVPLRLDLSLIYLNTSSVKSLFDLLDLLEDAHIRGLNVGVTWYYDPENDRALEMAEEFREEVTMPFEVAPEG
jgi:hypothetical protein